MKGIVEDILNGVEAGEYIYSTMEYYSRIFPPIYISIIKVGELSGSLADSLKQALIYLEENEKIKSYEILKEEQSKTGKYVRVSFTTKNNDDKENEGEFYLTKDDDGSWKILMFGSEKLMEE